MGATSLEDAIARATRSNQATGHSFNLASKFEKKLVNIEVKPAVDIDIDIDNETSTPTSTSPHVITHIPVANCYIYMDADADCSISAQHRMTRASELPPAESIGDVLNTLGDTEDKEYPIYRSGVGDDADTGYTLSTVLFNLEYGSNTNTNTNAIGSTTATDASVTIYLNNPKTEEEVHFKFNSLDIV